MLSVTDDFTVVEKKPHCSLVKKANVSAAYDHDAFMEFIQRQALKRRAKELASLLDLTESAVAKLRDGTSAASGPTITKWCQRDDDFRSAYFKHCGGHIEAQPSLVKGLNAAISAVIAGEA